MIELALLMSAGAALPRPMPARPTPRSRRRLSKLLLVLVACAVVAPAAKHHKTTLSPFERKIERCVKDLGNHFAGPGERRAYCLDAAAGA